MFRSNKLFHGALLLALMTGYSMPPAGAYHKCGLVDRSGREIVPTKYSNISDLGNNLFFVTRLWDKNPYRPSYDGFVVDSKGRELKLDIPPGYTLAAVYLPKTLAKGEDLAALPGDTVLQIHGPDGVGLADMQGKILVDAKYSEIWQITDSKLFLTSETKSEKYFFDIKTNKLTQAPDLNTIAAGSELMPIQVYGAEYTQCGYLRKDGTVAIKPIFEEAEQFAPNGLAKVRLHYPDLPSSPANRTAYIDKTGKIVSPHYLIASGYLGDHAAVVLKSSPAGKLLWGIIDQSFKARPLPGYTELFAIDQNLFAGRPSQNAPLQAITAYGTVRFIFPANVKSVREQDGYFLCGINAESPSKQKFIAIDKSGKLIDDNANFNYYYNYGLRVVQANPGKDGSLSHVEEMNGKIVIPEERATYSLLSPNILYKIVYDDHFSQAAWHDKGTRNSMYRDRELAHLLKYYNLIGMSRAEIENLLGAPDNIEKGVTTSYYYSLQTSFCGNAAFGLEFDFDADGKVKSYYIPDPVGERSKQKKYTKDMVVDESTDYPFGSPLQLVEKPKP